MLESLWQLFLKLVIQSRVELANSLQNIKNVEKTFSNLTVFKGWTKKSYLML